MTNVTRVPSAIRLCLFIGLSATTAGHVLLPFTRHVHARTHGTVARRDDSGRLALSSAAGFAYVVTVSVGTPPQIVGLAVSPSVGETWVPDAGSKTCNAFRYYLDSGYSETDLVAAGYRQVREAAGPCAWGSYNRSASATYLAASSDAAFHITYADGTYESGLNFTDKLTVGDMALDGYAVGLVEPRYHSVGVLGLGLNRTGLRREGSSSPSPSPSGGPDTTDNIMARLVAQGKSNTLAYSMWLDDASGSSGNVLFGAVDTAKYLGRLKRLRALDSHTSPGSFGVEVVDVTMSRLDGDSKATAMPPTEVVPFRGVLDTSAVFSHWPQTLADKMAHLTGASYNDTWGMLQIPCDAARDGELELSFRLAGAGGANGGGGPMVDVPLADLIVTPASAAVSLPARYAPSFFPEYALPDGTCFFGIQNKSDSPFSDYTIGAPLLRRSYLVFDSVNGDVGIAPAKFDTAESTLVAFQGYGATIPASDDVECRTDDPSCRSAASAKTMDGLDSSSSSALDHGGMAGWKIMLISVALGLVALVIAVALQRVWTWTCLGKRVLPAKKDVDVDTERLAKSSSKTCMDGVPEAPPSLPAIRPQKRITENFRSPSERTSHATSVGTRLRGLSHAGMCREANRALLGKTEDKGK